MGMSGEATIYLAAPDKGIVEISIPGFGDNIQGFQRRDRMVRGPRCRVPRLLEGGELSALKNQTRIHGDLEYDELYSEQTAIGETEWNGQAAHQIDLVDVDGNESSRYFAVGNRPADRRGSDHHDRDGHHGNQHYPW